MSAERVAYRYPHVVAKVEEVRKTISGHKDKATGDTVIVTESLGWFVMLDPGGIAYPVGAEKPALKPGDRVELVLRPAEPPAEPEPAPTTPSKLPSAPAALAREVEHVG